jgi:hypothetical protein
MPALSETPPAKGIEEMEVWYHLGKNGAEIAVAEQYHHQPDHVPESFGICDGLILGWGHTFISLGVIPAYSS